VVVVAVLVVLALATPPIDLAGAVLGDHTPEAQRPSGAPARGVSSSADDAAADTDDRANAPVTLAFGGDVHFEDWLGEAVRTDPDGALAPLRPLLAGADLAVVNLETAVTDRGTPSPKQYNFRAPAEGVAALAAAGVDVVSIANNHGMDYGVEGLADTLAAAEHAGVAVVGGGMSATAAYRPHTVTVHGRRVAVLGATQVLDRFAVEAWTATDDRAGLASAKEAVGGLSRLEAAVRSAATTADTVVVMLHWGREGDTCPLPRQATLAARLREAGADIVVGGHAHRLAGGGWLGDTVVHYGLGNLVFYARSGPGTTSGALAVTVAPDGSMDTQWRPAVLREGVATTVPTGQAAAVAAWEQLRTCTGLAAGPGAQSSRSTISGAWSDGLVPRTLVGLR
jgi:poly-gamma-glutamate synthesis protein (capsule biosynthesis protein)